MTSWILWLVSAAQATSPIRAGFVEALDNIVQRSPVVARQLQLVEGTRAKNLPNGALLWAPSLSAQAKALSEGESTASISRRSLEGVAELNLFRFGADLAAAKAATREINFQEQTLQNTLLTVEAEGVSALVSFIQAQRQREVTERILSSRKDALAIARRRYSKGQLPSEEVDKVTVDLDNAAAQVRDAESELAQTMAELERLLGESEIASEWPWKESLPKLVPLLMKRTASDLTQRPDWKAAAYQVEVTEQRGREAWRQMLPRLDARASYGYFSAETLGMKTTGPAWTAGLTLSVPLFDRLVGYSQYATQVHARGGAEADFEGVKRAAKKDWDAARATLTISLDTALAREKTLAAARKLYQASLERFNRGILSANDFRIDQDRLYQTESFVLSGWASAHNDFRRLCHATGQRLSSCLQER